MWKVKIHKEVFKEDFKKINFHQRLQILKTIKKKLTLDPKSYGEPLRGEFKGYWKLRVEDFRIIYRIFEEKILVLVIKVGIRRDAQVYKELLSRIKKILEEELQNNRR